jgi:ATP-dependent exoDNAse (exonuclease V) beta subunit
MTIHKSKGLDFPIVIAAALGMKKKTQTKTLLADRHKQKLFAVKAGDQASGRWTEGWNELDAGDRRREDAELARLLYVALTRARDHLFLSTHTCGRIKMEEGALAPDVSGTRLEPLKAVLTRCLSGGMPGTARRIDVKQLDSTVIPAAAVPDSTGFGDGIESVERQYRELSLVIKNTLEADPSQADAKTENQKPPADTGVENRAATARRRSVRLGTAFHEIMERVDFKDLTGLEALLRETGARHNLDGTNRRKLGDMVEKCLDSDLMRRASAAARTGRRVLRETPFVHPLKEGGAREGRIDLLFEEGGTWTLVDYKTGRIPQNMKETGDAETYFRDRYADQARIYRDVLESLSIKVGGVFLLLARTGSVIEIEKPLPFYEIPQ